MDKMIAACGLICSECPSYLATQADDADAIARIAEEWSKAYQSEIRPEHVWCDGCFTDSARKCAHCAECDVRACVVEHAVANCAACDDFGCAIITRFMEMAPPARANLEALRAGRAL